MPGRNYPPTGAVDQYRFGFNGKEEDKWNGDHGAYADFGARMYDERLGRFFTPDSKAIKYPNYSPYLFAGNRPIDAIDYEGEGPRYPAIAAAFERKLNQLSRKGSVSFTKFDQSDINQIVFSVNFKINGHVIHQMFEFNEKTYDQGCENLLMNWGVDTYDAIVAASNSFTDRTYWRLAQSDEHYKKPENGIPLLFKTWATVLTLGAAAEGMAAWNIGEKTLFAIDGALMLDDLSSLFNGPNLTFLEYLAEKTGFDPKLIEQAKTANDILQGLSDIHSITTGIKERITVLENTKLITKDVAISGIEYLNFIQGQIDMQKHYWELMKAGMGDLNKNDTKKGEEKPGSYQNPRYLD